MSSSSNQTEHVDLIIEGEEGVVEITCSVSTTHNQIVVNPVAVNELSGTAPIISLAAIRKAFELQQRSQD